MQVHTQNIDFIANFSTKTINVFHISYILFIKKDKILTTFCNFVHFFFSLYFGLEQTDEENLQKEEEDNQLMSVELLYWSSIFHRSILLDFSIIIILSFALSLEFSITIIIHYYVFFAMDVLLVSDRNHFFVAQVSFIHLRTIATTRIYILYNCEPCMLQQD